MLSNFEKISLIGKGSISMVYLVKDIVNEKPYAMKVIRKDYIIDSKLLDSAKLEKEHL